jgi:DNA-binding transcriptional ArsR family regulator
MTAEYTQYRKCGSMSDNSDDSFNASRAEVFEALGHPTRIRLLQCLSEKPLAFSELKRAAGIEGNGLLSFHLGKLGGLVKLNPEGAYTLTDEGREALRIVEASKGESHGGSIQLPSVRPQHLKTILAALVVVLIILAAASAIEYNQIQGLDSRVQTTTPFPPGTTLTLTASITTTTTVTTVRATTLTIITSAEVADQYLNMSQAAKEGASFISVGCTSVPCDNATQGTTSIIMAVPGMTYFFAQIDATAPGVWASASPQEIGNTAYIDITFHTNSTYTCFEYLVQDAELPPTVYVWLHSQGTCSS